MNMVQYTRETLYEEVWNEPVSTVAKKYGVSMSEVALAWHYAKGVAAPIVGATKISHFDQAVKSVDLTLSGEDVKYLDELFEELAGAFS